MQQYTLLTKMTKTLAVLAIGVCSLQVHANTNKQESSANDIIGQLKTESKGLGRTRFGMYGAVGYQGAINSDVSPSINGLVFDGGVYVLVNPIKQLVDVEVGTNIKYNPGLEINNKDTGSVKYQNGLSQATVYAGPVFQVGKSAIGVGASKALYLREEKGNKDDKTPRNELSNGLGVYAEYQWDGKRQEGSRYTIPFARLTVERFDLTNATTKNTSEQTVVGVVFGAKY